MDGDATHAGKGGPRWVDDSNSDSVFYMEGYFFHNQLSCIYWNLTICLNFIDVISNSESKFDMDENFEEELKDQTPTFGRDLQLNNR